MERILIVRLSAIGDVIMASGIVPALKSRYPDAHIAWLAEPAAQQILKETNGIDQIISWPRHDWQALWKARQYRKLWRAIREFREQLHQMNFDIAVDVQGLLKSSFLAWLSGAPKRYGFKSKEKSHWFLTDAINKSRTDPRISSEYRQMAKYLGADPEAFFRMTIGYHGSTLGSAKHKLQQLGVTGDYAVMLPFTTRPQKHWFDEHWHDFVTQHYQRYGVPLVMLGGPADEAHAQKIMAHSNGEIVNLVGQTSLVETAAIIEHAQCGVGVDTGLTHLCIAMETPVVAIFGSTRPYIDTGWAGASVIYHDLECSPCRRRPTCDGAFTCLRGINADEVMTELEKVLHAHTAR
ncbi:glycosyltransferase family 9 protein [Echinimonas agarilytica]|uniref:Glycosyltransferase family 9 protein n=1 Tax=Echinimonas agarilytica TaxID=1215918 RepID=A0AA41W8C5_9GAMM|nr:glycosyltransferase family 9 protein [Echinimonas agarilytica]MCM2680810.1 glycosyltransferase family 9 protein [Echinimonas agarilytica]